MLLRVLLSMFIVFSLNAIAQNKKVNVSYITEEIKLDAVLNEASWYKKKPATDFWQYFPTDTLKAINQTEITMLFDDHNLYLGIKVYSSGNNYIIPSLKRDFRAGGSDNITLLFDTYNDGSNAFLFGINPDGVMREALVSGGGKELRGFTSSWDTKWESVTKQYDDYYISEWEIPLSAFKYKEGETRWRFNSYMFDTQSNERTTWIQIPQNQFIFNLAFMDDMVFEKPLGKSKTPISIIPYINTIAINDYEENKEFFELKAGGDAKISISNSLNLDITVNPDFSQVEADQVVTNLTRFEVNLPEKRQFFIENSDLFADFGNSLDANPFFSRRIGIAKNTSDTYIENDIIGGLRLSGKINTNFRVGLLNVQTKNDSENEIGGNNNTVLALQQKVFSRSNVSFLFINRQDTSNKGFITPEEKYNRVVGIDYNLANKDNSWNGKFYAHKSFTANLDSKDYSAGTRLDYSSKNWRIRASGLYIGGNFKSDLGFIRRTDIFKIDPKAEYLLFPKKGKINRHSFSVVPITVWKPEINFQLADYNIISSWNSEFNNTSRLSVSIFNRYIYLFDEFDPSFSDGTPLARDTDYNFSNIEFNFQSDTRKLFSFKVKPSIGQFFNGFKYTFDGEITYRMQPKFLFSLRARYDKIELPQPYSTNNIWLVSPRIDITFTKSLYWSTLVQYSSLQDNLGINSRLQWRFAPLSDLFLVYNDNYFTESEFAPRFRSINLKITYWLYL
ncbi:MAG: carbohydrate binding family 9 domain-containing protein [Flavobacteriaceae bacterium]|nr:carbohydrate binding family 9 domain-containing protein [Flavobacteriaceae bacterium]